MNQARHSVSSRQRHGEAEETGLAVGRWWGGAAVGSGVASGLG